MATLYRFMTEQRDAILARSLLKIQEKDARQKPNELAPALGRLIDEIVGALAREHGLVSASPLPEGRSEAATAVGAATLFGGSPIGMVAMAVGAISDSMGELGGEHGLTFLAKEYQTFDQCIDSAVAAGIERFFEEAESQHDRQSAERLGFLAHELRNALSTARMAHELIRSGQAGIASKTSEILTRSLARMDGLIQHTLDSVQLRSGAELRARPVDVVAVLQEIIAGCAPERGVTMRVDVADGLSLHGDPRLVHSAVSNLVQNALKFTRDAGLVSVRAWAEGDQAVVEVEDQCGGLPPGIEARMFEPFARGTSSRSAVGLGLAIAREAVEAHGGHIRVTNLPGRGCVLRIELPLVPRGASES